MPNPSLPSASLALLAALFGLLWASGLLWVWLGIAWKQYGFLLPRTPREPIHWRPAVLAVSLGWMGLQSAQRLARFVRDLSGAVEPEPPLPALDVRHLVANAGVSGALILIIVAALAWQSPRRSLADYGIRFDGIGRQALVGFTAALMSALPVMTVALLMLPFRDQSTQHALLRLLRADPSAAVIVSVTVAAVVIAPLLEELIFRVVLQGWLVTVMPERAAIGLTAVVFAAVHGWPDAVPLIPLALILGVVYQRTHRWFAVVLLHALFNAVNLAFALVSIHALGGAH